MGQNNFLPFDENKNNILTDSQYLNSDTRLNGNETGIALSNVQNKALRQSTAMSTALGGLLAEKFDIVSDNDISILEEQLRDVFIPPPPDFIPYVPYSIAKGNVDANGFPDIITRVSDTAISFKVGGSYPHIFPCFPNGKVYEVSSVANVTGLSGNGTYIVIFREDQLTKLDDGTYSAVAQAINTGYSQLENTTTNLLTGFTSDTHNGITVSANYDSANAYLACDGNDATMWGGAGHQQICGNPYPFVPGSGGSVEFDVTFGTAVRLWKATLLQGYTWSSAGILYVSTNNGSTWINATGINGGNGSLSTEEFSSLNNLLINKAKFVFTASGQWHSSGGDCGTCGMDTYSLGLFLTNLVSYAGGSITEGKTFPTSPASGDIHRLTSINPKLTYLYNGTSWVEESIVKIGEFNILSNLIDAGTIRNYAFNRKAIIKLAGVSASNYLSPSVLNHNIGSSNIKPLSGVFNNITGAGGVGSVVNGASGFVIGMGASTSGTDFSSLKNNDSNTFTFYPGNTYLWIDPQGVGFTGADIVITVEAND